MPLRRYLFRMSTETLSPTFVGSLACQRNSFWSKDFKTVVLSCEPAKKKKQFHVELQDTILFPEGGGQPSDSGLFKVAETGEQIDVSSVSRKGLRAIHHVNGYVKPGSQVDVKVDWEQRLDYMQQHSGQHLLSALLEREWSLPTLSWSMGGVPTEKKPKVDPPDLFNYVELGRKLTDEEISHISRLCNEYISVDPQKISVVESTHETQSQSGVDASKIPDDYDLSQGILRTIHIGDLDSNPCCGTHLSSTSQLGSILILQSQTSVRGTNSRLYFTCGSRVLKYASFANSIINQTKSLLSCGEAELPKKVELQRDSVQKASKKEQYWMKDVAGYESTNLAEAVKKTGKGYMMRDEFGGLEFFNLVQKELISKLAVKDIKDFKVVCCGREKQSNSGVVMILSNSGEEIASIAAKLTEISSTLRGGGGKKGGKWQGKISEFRKGEWESFTEFLKNQSW